MMRASDVLPGAGRAVEDQREERVGLDRAAQPRALARRLLLADELVERARAHARGKRRDRSAVARGAIVEEGRAPTRSVGGAQDLALEEVLVGQAPELPDDVALAVGEDDERRELTPRSARELDGLLVLRRPSRTSSLDA